MLFQWGSLGLGGEKAHVNTHQHGPAFHQFTVTSCLRCSSNTKQQVMYFFIEVSVGPVNCEGTR